MARTCFIHIGTHKTGSTSLQEFLWKNRITVGQRGLHFPKALWQLSPPGHRIIPLATEDGSIDQQLESAEDLLSEIAAEENNVILSTEAYWTILPWPDGMKKIQSNIESAGFRVEYIVYLREQSQFLASWYSEISKIGNTVGFDQYVSQIVETGTWTSSDDAVSDFEYDRFLDNFQAVTERPIHVRSFHKAASGSLMQRDLLSICCRDADWPDGFFDAATWTNHRLGAHTTQALVQLNRVGRDGPFRTRIEPEVMRRAAERDRERTFDPYRPEQLATVRERFAASNRRLREKYGISLDDATIPGGLTWREITGPEEFRAAAWLAMHDVGSLIA